MTEEEAAQTADEEQAEQDAEEDVLGPEGTGLVARVAVADESLAADVEERLVAAESERRELEAEVDDLRTRLKRKQADFQNYKKRAKKRQERLEKRATEDLVQRLIDVRDNLRRAVEEEHENVESLREGVELTLKELDRVFEDENVTEIRPDPGEEVDPQRHEVMLRVESDHPEDTIAEVYQPGYEMAEKVLQSAQVTVSDGNGDEDDEE
ncbi:nucleotide exchange factor GrpE [Haladaptatus halobius]|uniref:nucleotide exchange factor GrpE n=1 Tax=Haladaptatus halobius TaxID=2884875 RepID=UPI001D09C23D|nr:nucleotide exchange factor GrpE [Haladaptatus halobius]